MPFNETKEVIVGYYRILARDINGADRDRARKSRFAFGTTARIEVRPIKTEDERPDYVYPK